MRTVVNCLYMIHDDWTQLNRPIIKWCGCKGDTACPLPVGVTPESWSFNPSLAGTVYTHGG